MGISICPICSALLFISMYLVLLNETLDPDSYQSIGVDYNAFLCERLQRLFIIVNPFQFFIQLVLSDVHACVNDSG